MPHSPKSSTGCKGMQTKLSAWTPLNHPLLNTKVFEERRSLLAKWFDRWSDRQRRAVLEDLVRGCSQEQLRFLSVSVGGQLPLLAADFTCLLPRALCLYIFSFLDPRSLCRCAQVSWHWKSIVDLDQLWIPKCVRLGWCAAPTPTAYQQSVWKRHYVGTVQGLRLTPPQQFENLDEIHNRSEDVSAAFALECPAPTVQSAAGGLRSGWTKDRRPPPALPPWRDADRRPKDTLRFNYLDNMEPMQQSLAGLTTGNTSHDGKKKPVSEATYKLRKAKSLMFLSSGSRPPPPLPPPPPPHHHYQPIQSQAQKAPCRSSHPVTMETAGGLLGSARWNAGVRPGPVRPAVPRLRAEALRVWQRSERSSPSVPLFEVPLWKFPASHTR